MPAYKYPDFPRRSLLPHRWLGLRGANGGGLEWSDYTGELLEVNRSVWNGAHAKLLKYSRGEMAEWLKAAVC